MQIVCEDFFDFIKKMRQKVQNFTGDKGDGRKNVRKKMLKNYRVDVERNTTQACSTNTMVNYINDGGK